MRCFGRSLAQVSVALLLILLVTGDLARFDAVALGGAALFGVVLVLLGRRRSCVLPAGSPRP